MPKTVLSDRMGCIKGGTVAGVVVPTADYVQVDQEEYDDGRPGRCWVVTLRSGKRSVVGGRGLGRFSAIVLSGELRNLLHPRPRQDGGAIE